MALICQHVPQWLPGASGRSAVTGQWILRAHVDVRPLDAPAASDRSVPRRRVVAFAHATSPGEGLEKGVGWIWARMLATIGPTVVIARAWPATAMRRTTP